MMTIIFRIVLAIAAGLLISYIQKARKRAKMERLAVENGILDRTKSVNKAGIAGFVLALCSFFLVWLPIVGIPMNLLAFVFSAVGLQRRPIGLAMAGCIISFLGFFAAILQALQFGIIPSYSELGY